MRFYHSVPGGLVTQRCRPYNTGSPWKATEMSGFHASPWPRPWTVQTDVAPIAFQIIRLIFTSQSEANRDTSMISDLPGHGHFLRVRALIACSFM